MIKKFFELEGTILGTGTKTEKLDIIKKKYPSVKVKKFDINLWAKKIELASKIKTSTLIKNSLKIKKVASTEIIDAQYYKKIVKII